MEKWKRTKKQDRDNPRMRNDKKPTAKWHGANGSCHEPKPGDNDYLAEAGDYQELRP